MLWRLGEKIGPERNLYFEGVQIIRSRVNIDNIPQWDIDSIKRKFILKVLCPLRELIKENGIKRSVISYL